MPAVALPWSAAVTRRLAEAADGHRDSNDVYFLVNPANLMTGVLAFGTLSAAEAKQSESGYTTWEIYGPFNTPVDADPMPEVDTVTIHYVNSTPPDLVLSGAEVDALFLTNAAFEKFCLPYYARFDAIRALRGTGPINHDVNSNPC